MNTIRICKSFFLASLIAPALFCSPLLAQATAPAAPASPAAATSAAPAAAWPADEAGLNALATKLVNGWFQQIADKDMKGVMAAMQPNFQVVTFEGVFDPATSMAHVSNLGTKSPTVSKVIATRVGDALVVTCLVKADQEMDGKKHANETDRARVIISSVSDVNYYGSPADNPLLVAIRQKNIEIVAALIDAGADLNPKLHSALELEVFSPVLEAVRVGDVDVLRCLCRAGADLTVVVVSTRQAGKTVMDIVDPRHEDLYDYLTSSFEQEVGNVSLI